MPTLFNATVTAHRDLQVCAQTLARPVSRPETFVCEHFGNRAEHCEDCEHSILVNHPFFLLIIMPGVSWVYKLHKEDLEELLRKHGQDPMGTVAVLRNSDGTSTSITSETSMFCFRCRCF